MITVPATFAAMIGARCGDAGRDWIAALPELVERYRTEWSLEIDGAALHGYVALVVPVRRADGMPAMLKLSQVDDEKLDESLALRVWAGDGAVSLLTESAGHDVLLLEKLDPHRSLRTEPIDAALSFAGGLLRRLAVPAPAGLRVRLGQVARAMLDVLPRRWQRLGRPFPRELLDHVLAECADLGPRADTLLVNADLHFENVLAARREPWLAIDPTVLEGDLEYGALALLWNRFDEITDGHGVRERLAAIIAAADLDPDLARRWTLVRTVSEWLWTLDVDPSGGPDVCAAIVAAIAPRLSAG
ncbi:MAG TPA: aminoglycoside phosphotransferase family protein [Pseudonocardiaceae bacterium]|jgi:streptomycin 6-kinase|nr:aminoglycoside phosphotransferase family protein [Pseudonocardiaceae bacterium]